MDRIPQGAVALAVVCGLAGPSFAIEGFSFEVSGNAELDDLLRSSSLLVAADTEGVEDPAEILAAARADYGRLVGALYSRSRYGPVINILVNGREAAEIPPITRLDGIQSVTVRVEPGPRYRFDQASIDPVAPGTTLPEDFRIGRIAESGIIRNAAQEGVEGWREVGRAKAEITGQDVIARHEIDRLSVDIEIAPGPEVVFGQLVFDGVPAVRPERLRDIAGLPTGEIFDPDQVDLAETRIRRTQVFSSAALSEAEDLRDGNVLDIDARLVAYPPRRIGFGAEVSSVEGLGLSGYWIHRNLLGGAERLRFDAEVSGIGGGTGGLDYLLGTRFERPATFSPENTLFLEANIARLDEPNYVSDTATIGAGISRIVNDDLTVTYGANVRFSRVEDDNGTQDYALVNLPLSALYDTRPEPLDAKRGVYVDLALTPFAGLNETTDNGARLTYDTRGYLSFGTDDRFTLAGRLQGGSILSADLAMVPNDYRFYSGGGGTVRGTAYQSLGVELNGIESGGASFVALSGEVRAGVTDNIGLVAFYDYGTVGRDAFPGSDARAHAGAGLGIRYNTPIGPIRLDVASRVQDPEEVDFDDDDDDSSFEVYIGIGQAF